jgi:hypothetical protein
MATTTTTTNTAKTAAAAAADTAKELPKELMEAAKATITAAKSAANEADKTGIKRQAVGAAMLPIYRHDSIRGINDFAKRRTRVLSIVLADVPRPTGKKNEWSDASVKESAAYDRIAQEAREAFKLCHAVDMHKGTWNSEHGCFMVPVSAFHPPKFKNPTLTKFAEKRLVLGKHVLLDGTVLAFDDDDGARAVVRCNVNNLTRNIKSGVNRGTKAKTDKGTTTSTAAPLSEVLLFVDNKLAGMKASEMDEKVREAAARALRTLMSVFGEQGAVKLYREYRDNADAAKKQA